MGSWGAVSCSHFPPPSFLPLHPLPSSSPPLSCITSCGDREERSEACSSPSVSHLVNCFPSSSPPYCTNSGIFFVLYFFCETQSYRKSAFFFSFHGDTFEEKTPVFQTCSYDSVLLLWYSDPVIIPLWLPLYVSTGVVKIGLLLCPCCQTFGEGCSVWSLTLEELKRGRNPQKMVWLGGEDDLSWSLRSLAFREQRESDVKQHLEVLDVKVLYSILGQTREKAFILQRRKKCFVLGKTLFFTFTTWLGCMDASRAGSKLFIELIMVRVTRRYQWIIRWWYCLVITYLNLYSH